MKSWRRCIGSLLAGMLLALAGCGQTDITTARALQGRLDSATAISSTMTTDALGSYNVDLSQSSVSGLSAGGYMAGQFLVAFSEDVMGAGIFAAGPYGCARGNLLTAVNQCMAHLPAITPSDIDRLHDMAETYAADRKIDRLENLENRSVYIFSGTNDRTVVPEVTDWVDDWFEAAGMPAANIQYDNDEPAGHALPTMDYLNDCPTASASPWMSDCNYDGAGEVLQHIYGPLNPKSPVTDTSGVFIQFPQNEFFQPQGLTKVQLKERYSFNEFGYAYVPEACRQGEPCRIHVVFHGCKQIYDRNPNAGDASPDDSSNPFGLQMVEKAGFNEWANTNNLIILYPQAQKTAGTAYIGGQGNPRGCFDWWGYIDGTAGTYATRKAPQMAAVYAMMERLAGAPSAAFEQAVQDGDELVVEGVITDPDDDITGLEIEFTYGEDQSTGRTAVDAFSRDDGRFRHAQTWPKDQTAYRVTLWVTYGDKPPHPITGPLIKVGHTCRQWTDTNQAHRSEGRAEKCWIWFNCARGSGEYLGFDNSITTVHQQDPDSAHYRRGTCPP